MKICFSEEQIAIARAAEDGFNIKVDAVAGSGKTTSIICLAEYLPKKSICVLLYNKVLADESRSKINERCHNVDIFTIHASGGRFYNISCRNDQGLDSIVSQKMIYQGKSYDILVCDEMQDMYPITMKYIFKLWNDLNKCQLILIGDYRQCIYQFKGADPRYLVNCDEFFRDENKKWQELILTVSYRCTNQIISLTNYLLNSVRIKGTREGVKPEYIIARCYSKFKGKFLLGEYISRKICIFLQDGYSLGDIFILAPSIRSGKSPVLHLSNYLSNKGYKIYTAANDKDDLDDREIRENKIICCSFHQSKGRERAIVIVMGFDDSLFEYYNQDRRDNPEKCPNRIYVAITRGKDHLFLVHDCKKKFLPFLGKEIFEICDLKQITREPIMEPKKMEKKEYSVNQLASHLSARSILELEQYFTVSQIKPPRYNIKIKSTVLIASSKENIRHIFETAILLLKSSEMKVRYNGILKYLEHCLTQKVYKEDFTMHLRKAINVLEKETKSYEDIAFLSNLYCCLNDGYVHPLNQITSYEWFPAQKIKIKQCLKELEFLKETDQIKVEVSDIFKVNNFEIKISGIIDCCFKNGNIWEIKCLSAIKTEDIFRLVVYACLDNNQREYYLFNVLSGEILKIEIPDENTKLFMKYIIGKKFEIAEGSIPLEKMISDIIS